MPRCSLADLTLECLAALDQLRPTGQGNPSVQLFARNLTQQRPPQRMGAEKQHLKLWVTDGHTTHEAVWWNAANETLPAAPFDLAFAPQSQRLQRPPHRAVEGPRLAPGPVTWACPVLSGGLLYHFAMEFGRNQ